MRILLIDDDAEIAERLQARLSDLTLEWVVAVTAAEGAHQLVNEEVDLIVCDLKMPARDAADELDAKHGTSAAARALVAAPGTPLIIYSGFRKEAEYDDLLSSAGQADLYGSGSVNLAIALDKSKPELLHEAIRGHHASLSTLNQSVELVLGGSALSERDKRVLRIYARSRGGTVATATAMDEGRSAARTFRLEVFDAAGARKAQVIAKLNVREQVLREASRFDHHVAGRLDAGVYAESVRTITAGAGNRAGAFYSFAGRHPETLFRVLERNPGVGGDVVSALRERLRPWHEASSGHQSPVVEIVDELCPAQKRAANGFEDHRLSLITELETTHSRCSSHADLHGGNVLVAENQDPMLIDLADAYDGPSLLDPMTLELTVALHPDSPFRTNSWPTLGQAREYTGEAWLENCPCPEFVAACRAWRDSLVRGSRDVDAVLLGIALRQLGHPGAREDLLDALVAGAIVRLASS